MVIPLHHAPKADPQSRTAAITPRDTAASGSGACNKRKPKGWPCSGERGHEQSLSRVWCMKRIMAVVVVLLSVAGCSSDAPNTDAPVVTDAPNTDAPNTDAPVVTDAPAPSETIGQENARESAQSYLDSQAFSRTGLIDQLLFEGFSQAEAEYGVNAVGL